MEAAVVRIEMAFDGEAEVLDALLAFEPAGREALHEDGSGHDDHVLAGSQATYGLLSGITGAAGEYGKGMIDIAKRG